MKRAHLHLEQALTSALHEIGVTEAKVILERPRDPEHGDIATNAAMVNAKGANMQPRKLAETILEKLKVDSSLIVPVGVAGPGFINFRFADHYLQSIATLAVEQASAFGQSETLKGQRVQIEFVSANPTGPLNVVSARAAAVGDSLSRIFRLLGAQCDREFYVNDAGNQVELLGQSYFCRYLETQGIAAEIPEGGYRGEYIAEIARKLAADKDSEELRKAIKIVDKPWKANVFGESVISWLGRRAMDEFISRHERSLEHFRVHMERWFRESELREAKAEWNALTELEKRGAIFQQEGAKFVRTSEYGDGQDWVVVTSQGRPTYFLPDIAYHLTKFRRGYDLIIDILGPDHHSYLTKMGAAMSALGEDAKKLEILLLQHINLLRDGEPVKMSKRAGQIIEMDELVEEVGVDAARYFFLMRKTTTPLDFDIELAKRHSDDNPVFYVQYAHARIESIFRRAGIEEPSESSHVELLTHPEELKLLRRLRELTDVCAECATTRDPHAMTVWLREVATQFHRFYHHCRVIGDSAELQAARLTLCRATQVALRTGLDLCGVSAPKEM
ncbi:arginine--tRNA ligase [bacterium]|nr:arginine--tRNA ligase [bacterium]